ncbi:hypothetical protein [Thermogemmatispora sp.]|uniref:hypothetical protein n=1 Tax=Thermogemmatispora sp. TaxID=1968838 RepID=UPI0035E45B4D
MQHQDPRLSELRTADEEKTSRPYEEGERKAHGDEWKRQVGRNIALPAVELRPSPAGNSNGSQHGQSASIIETNKWLVFVILAIGVFMATLDGSIVKTSYTDWLL